MSACDCGHEAWARRADEDSVRYLRFACSACGADGYKLFGEPDSAARPFNDAGRARIRQRRADEQFRARARREREDVGYFVQSYTGPRFPGGLPAT